MKIHPLTFFLTVLAVLIICLSPKIRKAKKSAAKAGAICGMKNIGISMTEFENQYGHRPLPNTAIKFPIPYPQRDRLDSNALLGQLIAAGTCDSEKIFTLKNGTHSSALADGNISSASEILKTGECHYTYITCKNGTGAYTGSSALPVIISHFIPGTSKLDHEIFDYSAAYLKLDSSVAVCKVTADGKSRLKGQGKLGLLDNGADTMWGDLEPQLHHPLPFYPSLARRTILSKPIYSILVLTLIYLLFRIFLSMKRRNAT